MSSVPPATLDTNVAADQPAAISPAVAASLVARNATAPQPTPAPAEPRSVAKTIATRGETVVGGATEVESSTGAISPTTAVKPTAPTNRPKPKKQPPSRQILPGDKICGECGEGNPPARNFCSRCGTSLVAAEIAKRPWWKRFVPRRKQKTMAAGSRPWTAADGAPKQRKRGGLIGKLYAKIRPIAALVLLAAGLLIGFSPNLRERVTGQIGDARDSVMRRIQPHFVPLAPVDVSANTETPDGLASEATDSNPMSFWVAGPDATEPTLVVRFDEPFNLELIKVWNGAATGFKDHARISEMHLVFDTGQSFDVEVNDLPDAQDYEIENGAGVQEVEVHIVGTHSSLTGGPVALSEIEFLFKK